MESVRRLIRQKNRKKRKRKVIRNQSRRKHENEYKNESNRYYGFSNERIFDVLNRHNRDIQAFSPARPDVKDLIKLAKKIMKGAVFAYTISEWGSWGCSDDAYFVNPLSQYLRISRVDKTNSIIDSIDPITIQSEWVDFEEETKTYDSKSPIYLPYEFFFLPRHYSERCAQINREKYEMYEYQRIKRQIKKQLEYF